jgi:hemolysin III
VEGESSPKRIRFAPHFEGVRRRVREPFLSLSHLSGALFGLVFFVFFTSYSNLDPKRIIALSIYGLTFVALFLASSVFHGRFHKDEKEEALYEKLDYIAIYLFIAGTYTPICLQTLSHSLATWVLSIQWSIALLGCVSIWVWGTKARGLQTVLFLVMGWVFLAVSPSIFSFVTNQDLIYLVSGALLYSIGAAVFALAPKRICNDAVCTHSIWHVFVLGGATTHLLLISDLIVR